ncbi:sugar phosphate isomerase/epimerase family protein [Haloferula sp. BvORR071]|uniref:sugar phosphate isomerase/epimerase family protein n=1 Tax=Haloferula sp. BvORR071 TaxID=1396141 RepID=UPI002240E91C|nr:sugar phosphate isomerase/epimerase family protein [Haloferula sp. BvORR071]
MKTAVTLCRVPEMAAGPFVFHDELDVVFAKAAACGYDAVELFFGGPDEVPAETIRSLCEKFGLSVAAIGSGAGMVKHGLSLTDCSQDKRREAQDFILRMIDFGGQLGAPVILGSMQGKWGGEVSRERALELLSGAFTTIDKAAADAGVPFIYEPLNRYETNLFNRLLPAAEFLCGHGFAHIVLLADLFHMNIEEADIAQAIRDAGSKIGHVHWADSNRLAMGSGHTDSAAIAAALRDISYQGYISAEIFTNGDPEAAARQTLASIRKVGL